MAIWTSNKCRMKSRCLTLNQSTRPGPQEEPYLTNPHSTNIAPGASQILLADPNKDKTRQRRRGPLAHWRYDAFKILVQLSGSIPLTRSTSRISVPVPFSPDVVTREHCLVDFLKPKPNNEDDFMRRSIITDRKSRSIVVPEFM